MTRLRTVRPNTHLRVKGQGISVEWNVRHFDALNTMQLYDILRLRTDVFVVEQACAYPELDGKDVLSETLHLTGRDNDGTLAAYLRILGPGISYEYPSFGRVVVAPSHRSRGLSHELVNRAKAMISQTWPGRAITIGAQEYLVAFYRSHGFEPVSEPYLEDGIPHVDMTWKGN